MPATAARAALGAVLLALAACSGGSVGPTPPPPTPPACKGVDELCGGPAECCSGDCLAGACDCSVLGEPCGSSADCCDVGTPRRCEAGKCTSGARATGDVCDWDGQCATLNCDWTGHCAPPCLGPNAACTESDQCCSGYFLGCKTGKCTSDCSMSGACTTDNDCCSGYGCRVGYCRPGACGTAGQPCASGADCCTAAQGGKNYFCNGQTGQCDIGQPGSYLGAPPDACTTDADCAGTYPCRGGSCHWQDGTQPDGRWCLDGQECAGGSCTATAADPYVPGVPGTCCRGAGTSCTTGGSSMCCAPWTCTGATGALLCGTCLDPTNSGPQGNANTQCQSGSQCCAGRDLTCVLGECCTMRGYACSTATECCAGDACGSVTSYGGTTTTQCCGDYLASGCGLYSACCDGLLCASGSCLKGPGQPCSGSGQCAEEKGVACNLSTGTCCSHADGPCDADADCCTNSCDTTYHRCNAVREYGSCLSEGDCVGPDYNQDWSGGVCGGNAQLGPGICCPVPGDTCRSQADCCEASDRCEVPLYVNPYGPDPDPTSPRCCRPAQAVASQGYECCTGMAERRSSTSTTQYCCGYPWMTTFTCTSTADCCSASGVGFIGSRCGDRNGVNRCCWDTGFNVGVGNDALCCSGQADRQFGDCK